MKRRVPVDKVKRSLLLGWTDMIHWYCRYNCSNYRLV